MSVAYDMVIEEREGFRRKIVLRGRSLPFQGIPFGTSQRVNIEYTPGNPVASSQVSGPEWLETTMNGKWTDIYLFDESNAPKLLNFPALQGQAQPGGQTVQGATFASGGTVPDQLAQTARAIRDAMFMISRSGMRLRFEWASIVRFGYLVEFTPIEIREEDVEWEAEFRWTGDTENQPIPAPQSKDMTSLLKQMLSSLTDVINVLSQVLFDAEVWQRRIAQTIVALGQFFEELLGTLERLVQFALSPAELFGTLKATLKGIQLAANDLIRTFKDVSAVVLASTIGDPAEVAINSGLQAAVRRLLIRLAAEGRLAREEIDKFDAPELLAVVVAPSGITLRDISLDQYGTAQNWKLIQDFNGFSSSVVPVGTAVRVPAV